MKVETESKEAVQAWIREGGNGGRLIDYDELALRVGMCVETCRQLKAARVINPAFVRGRTVVRFHWPSVQEELKAYYQKTARKGRVRR